jgi:peptide/nickel transport system substrate-binding protein
MGKKFFWLILSCLLVLSLLLASCGTKTTLTTTSTTILTTIPTTELTTVSTTTPTTKSATVAEIPQYGSTFTYRISSDPADFDPYFLSIGPPCALYLEQLAMRDLSINRSVFDFKTAFIPLQYWTGRLAENWEISSDFMTYTFHIRKGIQWQDKPPVNGRELTAYDIEWNYHRVLGLGSGFTKGSTYISLANWALIKSVTATDKYTIVMKASQPSIDQLRSILDIRSVNLDIVAREAVEKWGNVNDWRNAIGTGPFILKDYTTGSSMDFSKNPNYWGYDPVYPKNRLPYVDKVKILIIPDIATTMAALRTGKVDLVEDINWQQAASLMKTNPELLQVKRPTDGDTIAMMIDKKPFDDIRIRTAMQMAMDLKTIAKTYYGGYVDGIPLGLSALKGYYTPFNEWPKEIQAGYEYNPEGAKKLLTEAGYPNGFKCILTISSTADIDLFQVLKAYLLAINIDMQIQTMDSVSWSAYTQASKHELCGGGSVLYNVATYPPVNLLNQCYGGHTRNYNLTHLADPTYDAIVAKVKASISEEEIKKLVIEADMRAITQHWRISISPKVLFCVYQPWLQRFSGELNILSDAARWYWVDNSLKKAMGR